MRTWLSKKEKKVILSFNASLIFPDEKFFDSIEQRRTKNALTFSYLIYSSFFHLRIRMLNAPVKWTPSSIQKLRPTSVSESRS